MRRPHGTSTHPRGTHLLYHGAKHWFLRPPSEAIYSKEAIGAWLEREYAAGSQLECVQLGGDAMLLPEGWGHATLNLEASIGVTWELSLPGTGLQSAVQSVVGSRNYLQGCITRS